MNWQQPGRFAMAVGALVVVLLVGSTYTYLKLARGQAAPKQTTASMSESLPTSSSQLGTPPTTASVQPTPAAPPPAIPTTPLAPASTIMPLPPKAGLASTPTVTSTPTSAPTLTPTPALTPTPVPPPPQPTHKPQIIDMGNPSSETNFKLEGWGRVESSPLNVLTSPTGDRTKRFQILRRDSLVTFSAVEPGLSYLVIAEVEDGGCTDNFQILANGEPLYAFTGQRARPVIRVHTIAVPGNIIRTDQVRVTFRNTSTDDCGLAAVYNVRLEAIP